MQMFLAISIIIILQFKLYEWRPNHYYLWHLMDMSTHDLLKTSRTGVIKGRGHHVIRPIIVLQMYMLLLFLHCLVTSDFRTLCSPDGYEYTWPYRYKGLLLKTSRTGVIKGRGLRYTSHNCIFCYCYFYIVW